MAYRGEVLFIIRLLLHSLHFGSYILSKEQFTVLGVILLDCGFQTSFITQTSLKLCNSMRTLNDFFYCQTF